MDGGKKNTRVQGENGRAGGGGFIDSAVGGKLSEHLVSRSQLGPGLVSSPIVILGVGHFHVLVEPQDFSGLQLCDRRPLTQLQETLVGVTLWCRQAETAISVVDVRHSPSLSAAA